MTIICGVALLGSSPHPRGAPPVLPFPVKESRIIPASAGSTGSADTMTSGHGDHPRIRGEHPTTMIVFTSRWGSSPHPRGALFPREGSRRPSRIIPASAGSTV